MSYSIARFDNGSSQQLLPKTTNIGTTEYEQKVLGNTTAHIIKLPLSDVELFITPATSNNLLMTTVSDQVKQYDLDGAVNGDGFTYIDVNHVKVDGRASSNGIQYSSSTTEQTIYISQTNQVTDTPTGNLWNAISYPNRLITNGVINPSLDDSFMAAWTMVGTIGNLLYLVVIDGIEGSVGLTKKATALFAQTLGLTNAYLMDGGGSSTMVYGGKIVNQPHDTNTQDIRERQVANILGFKSKVLTPPTGKICTIYSIKSWNEMNIPLDGSFSQIVTFDAPVNGTGGVTNQMVLEKTEIDFIKSLNTGGSIFAYPQLYSGRHGTTWGNYYRVLDDGTSPDLRVWWNWVAAPSSDIKYGRPRNKMCVSNVVNGMAQIVTVPKSPSYEQYRGIDWLVWKVWGNWNGMPQLWNMLALDPASGFETTKSLKGFWIPIEWLYAEVGTVTISWL